MYYAIIDCDNCYVSCERVFRPDLNGKAVVVLSNNDGCVVARSQEAKQLGIRAGMPYYQMRQQWNEDQVVALSSNYELYGELTARVMNIIRSQASAFFRYSIDEGFAFFDDSFLPLLKEWGERLHRTVKQQVGIPVSIGIASTKTLAKVASRFAKRYAGYRHCCLIDTDHKRDKALQLTRIGDVWGIGRRHEAHLQGLGVSTAAQFAAKSESWIRINFNNKMLIRTWKELQGTDCVPNEEPAPRQSICTSRTFSTLLSDSDAIHTHVATYASRCAEKLRKQHSAATIVSVFIATSPFREDLPQHHGSMDITLLTPTNSTLDIVKAAEQALHSLLRPNHYYKRAGVTVMGLVPDSVIQTNIFDFDAERYAKMRRLDAAVDSLNKQYGSDTIALATQQPCPTHRDKWQPTDTDKASTKGQPALSATIKGSDHLAAITQHNLRTPNPTTRWSDIINLK